MNKLNELMTRLYIQMTTKKPGQGVVEYAGAMIVAALIVLAVLSIGTQGMGNVYNTIFNGVQNFFTAQAGNL